MSAIDVQPNPAPASPPAPSTPTSPNIHATQHPKRSLFGLKKKSTQNLGSSPSSNTLASAASSLKSGESVESLDKLGSGGPNGGKKRIGVFGKKSKPEAGGAGFTNTEGDRESGGITGGGRRERSSNKERASEVDSSKVVYESDEDMTPQPTAYPSGILTLSPTSPTSSNGQLPPAPGKKPIHAATFSPSNTAVSFGNVKPDAGLGKRGVGILGVPFIRRSTSPRPDGIQIQNTTTGGTLSPVSSGSPGILETKGVAEARPATSGGERKPEDQSRRAGRSSIGTSDASDIHTILLPKVAPAPRNSKPWPNTLTTDNTQSTPISQSSVNADGSPVMTTVTPPTPTEQQPPFPLKSQVGAVQTGNTRMNRGGTTNSLGNASRLSHSMTVPLTPANEGGALDGIQQTSHGNTAGGFFQSMFSVAQSAAATLGNSIANTNIANAAGARSRSSTGASEGGKGDVEKENMQQSITEPECQKIEPQKRPAVETLGQGELSLGSLGILPGSQAPNTTATETKPSRSASVNSHGTNSETDLRAVVDSGGVLAQAGGSTVPVARIGTIDGGLSGEALRSLGSAINSRGGFEIGVNAVNDSGALVGLEGSRKTPLAEDSAFVSKETDYTPEKAVLGAPDDRDDGWFGGDAERRSGSVMSGNRRKRGSSAASGGNLQPVPKLTGFAVAPKRRNREFHEMFTSVPEDDYLIEDYGCALQKEILLQGRLYVSEGHICFNSNIFGWINTLVISFDEIVSVEKKNTAMVFPNAIVIQTLHARNVFASLISRDSTYDLIVGIWKIGHPQLVAGATGVRLRDGGDAEEGDQVDGVSEYEEDGEVEDEYEDESCDDGESYTDASDGALSDGRAKNEGGVSKPVSRKVSQAVMAVNGGGNPGGVVDYPGPLTHAPTSCDDTHYDKLLCDDVILAPLGKVYSLVYGPGSYPFMSKFLADEEKVLEISIPDKGVWVDGPDGKQTRSFSYIKPLNNGIGPKQTKCNITETLDVCNLESHVTVTVTTQTPDVPSGNVFMIKTRYCLSWAEDGATRFVATCTVEWNGKSWLKVPIEKGAGDGQVAYTKSLLIALKREVEPKEPVARRTGNKARKRKKGGDARGEVAVRSGGATKDTHPPGFESQADQSDWGIFAPLKAYLGPIADIFGPLIRENLSIVAIFVVLAFFLYLQTSSSGGARCDIGRPRPTLSGRHWEEVWKNEEEGLRGWLEDRFGLGNVEDGRRTGDSAATKARDGLIEERKEREVEDALVVMEELLKTLRRVVEDRKQARGVS